MSQDRLSLVLAAGLRARAMVPASEIDAKFAQEARKVLLKHRAAQGFKDPPPKGPLVDACCSEKGMEGMEAKGDTCAHSKEGPEFEALQRRVEQLEMLVRLLLSQPSRPFPAPMGAQISAASSDIDLRGPPERSVSRC